MRLRSGHWARSSSGASAISEASHPTESPRLLSRSLSGYLCGTHSGVGRRRGDRLDLPALTRAHANLDRPPGGPTEQIGGPVWAPAANADALARALRRSLDRPEVLDLVLFGSQARGTTTGFSDIDAILVIDDAAADDPNVLRKLRPRVLAAQRAVLDHQPAQHHGFEVVTPGLLVRANEALGMPAVALIETRTLLGREFEASFAPDSPEETRNRLARLVAATTGVSAWPSHPWQLHATVSMFELLPALYLQALGHAVPKWRSFDEARTHFGKEWWPYDVLKQVRDDWVRRPAPALRLASSMLRNPWLGVAAWRRAPAVRRQPAAGVLTDICLEGLRGLATGMRDRAC